MLVSIFPASLAESAAYIPAPYNPAEVDPTVTYLEPAFYENENGPTIGVTTVGVINQDGLYFRDSNNNQVLDDFEDWRLDAKVRATDMVSKMTLEDQAGFVVNALMTNPVVNTLEAAKNEDGTINPGAIVAMVPDGEESKNAYANGFASLDSFVINTQKVRAAVYRGNLGFEASTVALLNNVITEMAEADSALRGVPAIPATLISNPISAGFPDTQGMAAAAAGDGNYDAIREYAEVDRQMWIAQGINAMYGPQIDLASDPRWPRNNTTYGERPEVTAGIITALVEGYQNGTGGMKPGAVALSVKHFPGDGSSENGFESHSKTGQWRLYPTAGSLEKYQLVGFQAAIDAGAGSIMPCYSRDSADARSAVQTYRGHEIKVNQLGSAYNPEIITTLLRDIMGFDGYVNTDSGIVTTQNYGVEDMTEVERYAQLIRAGSDAIGSGLRTDYIIEAVNSGILDKADLDRANINRATSMFQQGRFDNPYVDYVAADAVRGELLATASKQAYALHQKAVVMLKNSDNTLPVTETGKKVYIASFTGKGADDSIEESFKTIFEARGFEIVSKASKADIAYLFVNPTATSGQGATSSEAVLSLVEEYEVDERDKDNDTQAKTGDKITVTTLEDVDKIPKIAEDVHANGGKVIATIECSSPWILTNLEPYCDALLVNYTITSVQQYASTASTSILNAFNAQLDVMTGVYAPTGKLAVTLVSSEDVVALHTETLADGTEAELCASPNDVPGYDKDQYIDPAVLANVPGGSYAYQDANGNYYVSGFGLSY
ncbi:MAG: glycoside hydrolase family 3 C-terminal domain-containing protein [Clostridia bacterium]|nr:glycoside hydrolase family 3 C-terminal domain-containing protein [Clostridia bacterium]